jgi:predicted nucleic acid-binding protein
MRALIPGELETLAELLGRLELHDVDRAIAELAAALGATYRLRAPDAVHLATAIHLGADRFVTNNSRDFPKSIGEIEIVYPSDLS